jgi:hypothetical protein
LVHKGESIRAKETNKIVTFTLVHQFKYVSPFIPTNSIPRFIISLFHHLSTKKQRDRRRELQTRSRETDEESYRQGAERQTKRELQTRSRERQIKRELQKRRRENKERTANIEH